MKWLRICRRLMLTLLLTGLGLVLYERSEPIERWRVALEDKGEEWYATSRDGRFSMSHANRYREGPVRKRDLQSGRIIAELPRIEGDYECTSHILVREPWRPYWAGLPSQKRGVLDLFDLETGDIRRLPIEPFPGESLGHDRRIFISPRNDTVAVLHYHQKYHEAGWDSWFEILKLETHLYVLPGGERLDHFVVEAGFGKRRELYFRGDPQFSPAGSYLVLPSRNGSDLSLRLWDTRKRKLAGILPVGTWRFEVSPDERFLLAEDAKKKTIMWNLSDLDRPVAVGALPKDSYGYFSPDSRTLVANMGNEVVFWDLMSARENGRTVLGMPSYGAVFSPDGTLVAVGSDRRAGTPEVVMVLDTRTREILWSSPIRNRWLFDASGAILVLTNGTTYDMELRDARTGALQASFPRPSGYTWNPELSGNGRRAVVEDHLRDAQGNPPKSWLHKLIDDWLPRARDRESDWLVRVIDLPTGKEILRLQHSQSMHPLLSWDGNSVLLQFADAKGEEGPHVRCYDLPPRRPWLTIAGIPAGIGVAFLLLGAWLKRRRESFRARSVRNGRGEGNPVAYAPSTDTT
ncbi:MAG TPA: WD40 repeat domain-containing protein [Gemmataceae bacterium]|nr:WD40 repeat domain-containing protein [Gemmataceae bacterium]